MDPVVAHILEQGTYPPGFKYSGLTYQGMGSNRYEGLLG
jgi:hypothetical protein